MKKDNKNTIYILWAGGIIICLFLVLFALLFSSCSKGSGTVSTPAPTESASPTDSGGNAEPEGTIAPVPPDQVDSSPSYELAETADAGQEYIDKLTFLGDSTTHGLQAYGVLTGGTETTQVWTPESGTLTLSNQSFATIVYPETGEQLTIADAVEKKLPEYLVITLGVNGVSFMDEEYFTTEYTALIKSVQAASPDTKIICNSIYPVASYYENLDSINTERINAANEWISSIAAETGVKYCNSAKVITGSDGFLINDYCNGDGIHLNSAGFLKILEYMRTHAYQ